MKLSERIRKAGNSFANVWQQEAADHLWGLADEVSQLESSLAKAREEIEKLKEIVLDCPECDRTITALHHVITLKETV